MSSKEMVSVIVVNYNGAHLLPECLSSLTAQDYPSLEILVVDNGSIDESEGVVHEHGCVFISLGENCGLSTAYNRGAEKAKGEYLFFVNNDMRFEPNCIEHLVEALATNGDTFASDPLHYNWEGDDIIHFRTVLERIRSPRELFSHLILPKPPLMRSYVPCTEVVAVPWGCAGSLMVDREMFWALGGWDEKFFLDMEDIDLCWRAWLRGWATVFVPHAQLYHRWGASNDEQLRRAKEPRIQARLERTDFRRLVSQQKNHLRFALKVLDVPSVAALIGIKFVGLPLFAVRRPIVARAFVWALGRLVKELPEIRRLRQSIHRSAVCSSRDLIHWFILANPGRTSG